VRSRAAHFCRLLGDDAPADPGVPVSAGRVDHQAEREPDRNRTHVSMLRFAIGYRQAIAERIGTTGEKGTRNG
jgi:hypothetical protein